MNNKNSRHWEPYSFDTFYVTDKQNFLLICFIKSLFNCWILNNG